MKERPILFSGAMVRAILACAKHTARDGLNQCIQELRALMKPAPTPPDGQ